MILKGAPLRRHLLSQPLRAFAYVLVLSGSLMLAPSRSYAYLDPGTGSYVFQLALALLLGALFTTKLWWQKVRTFLRRVFRKEP